MILLLKPKLKNFQELLELKKKLDSTYFPFEYVYHHISLKKENPILVELMMTPTYNLDCARRRLFNSVTQILMKMANNSPHLENLSHNENCAIYWKEHERLFEIYGCYEVTVEGSFTKNIFVPKEEIAEIPKFTKFSKKLNRKKIFEMIQEFKKEQKKDI